MTLFVDLFKHQLALLNENEDFCIDVYGLLMHGGKIDETRVDPVNFPILYPKYSSSFTSITGYFDKQYLQEGIEQITRDIMKYDSDRYGVQNIEYANHTNCVNVLLEPPNPNKPNERGDCYGIINCGYINFGKKNEILDGIIVTNYHKFKIGDDLRDKKHRKESIRLNEILEIVDNTPLIKQKGQRHTKCLMAFYCRAHCFEGYANTKGSSHVLSTASQDSQASINAAELRNMMNSQPNVAHSQGSFFTGLENNFAARPKENEAWGGYIKRITKKKRNNRKKTNKKRNNKTKHK